MADENLDQQENVEPTTNEFNPVPPQDTQKQEIKEPDASIFDVPVTLSKEDEEKICSYLEDNLPKMRPPDKERDMITSYFAMYEMLARGRSFPYEGAPSLASSDAHDKMNEWLDQAEMAFMQSDTALSVDREETNLPEEKVNRIEKTFNRKYYKDVLIPELRQILFEAGYLGASIVHSSESYDVRPVREKIIVTNTKQLQEHSSDLSKEERSEAASKINKGEVYTKIKESIQVDNIGPVTRRVDQTKFWFPRNTKKMSEWQLVSEVEFMTKSSLRQMVALGEFDSEAVEDCISKRKDLQTTFLKEETLEGLPENVKTQLELDSNWQAESSQIKEMGDAYEEEFALYRCTLLYGIKTEADPSGRLRSWIQGVYCPAGGRLLGKKYCQDGFPYEIIQKRPLPYKAFGNGIAQERFNNNILDTELKSLFLASIEQEVGAPLLVRKNSSLFASGFRSYPASVAYCDDPAKDAAFLPFPQKSRLAVEAMTIVLGGGSPGANKGLSYSSGKKEELQIAQEMKSVQSSVQSIAMSLDKVIEKAWKIYCRLSKYNRPKNIVVPWVVEDKPLDGTKLYVLQEEMNPNLVWTSIPSAVSLSPDARLQKAMQKYMFFHKNNPVSVNDPALCISWDNYMADYFGLAENEKKTLLPSVQTFQRYQSSLGQQGAQTGGNPTGGGAAQPPPSEVPPLVAQSPSNPNHRPPQ